MNNRSIFQYVKGILRMAFLFSWTITRKWFSLQEFLNLASRWAIVNVSSAIKLYGVSLSNPVSMVMEYLPLGPLNVYLANNIPHIKEVNLVEAATYLANALYYLVIIERIVVGIRAKFLTIYTLLLFLRRK